MNKSYAFTRPISEVEPVAKKSRRVSSARTDGSCSTFKYSCYSCSNEMVVKTHDSDEIECGHCGGRILKKAETRKSRVVEAI